jgi:NAD(P)H dehydrogenase (quinone)
MHQIDQRHTGFRGELQTPVLGLGNCNLMINDVSFHLYSFSGQASAVNNRVDMEKVDNMKILVILGHPDPESFNHAIASVVCESLRSNGHMIMFHDLYAEKFDPILTKQEIPENGIIPASISLHCAELQAADGIVIIHPNWWGQPPALLKGWIDRVIRPGVAYSFVEGDGGEGVPAGLLKAKAAVIFNTSNTPDEREHVVFGDPLEAIWKRCIFALCGIHAIRRRTFNVVVTSSPAQRRQWLNEAQEIVADLF